MAGYDEFPTHTQYLGMTDDQIQAEVNRALDVETFADSHGNTKLKPRAGAVCTG